MILPALVCFELKRAVVSSTTRNLDHVRVLGTVFAVSKSNECTVVSASLGAPGYRLRDPALALEIVDPSRCIASTRSTISPACPR
jgi:hypothetical protein